MKVKFYGHAGIRIEDNLTLLIDPWLNDNPLATMKAEDILEADYIIATHNHFDHVNDITIIAENTGATVVAIVETAEALEKNLLDPIGGLFLSICCIHFL